MPCVVFLDCVHLASFLALSVFPGNSLVTVSLSLSLSLSVCVCVCVCVCVKIGHVVFEICELADTGTYPPGEVEITRIRRAAGGGRALLIAAERGEERSTPAGRDGIGRPVCNTAIRYHMLRRDPPCSERRTATGNRPRRSARDEPAGFRNIFTVTSPHRMHRLNTAHCTQWWEQGLRYKAKVKAKDLSLKAKAKDSHH